MKSVGSMPTPHPAIQAPQTPAPGVYPGASSSLGLSQMFPPQSVPLSPPLTPAQTPASTTSPSGQQQVTRSPPLLQPRPQLVQPTIQVRMQVLTLGSVQSRLNSLFCFNADAHAGDPHADPELPCPDSGSDPQPDSPAHTDSGGPDRDDRVQRGTVAFHPEPRHLPPEPCSRLPRCLEGEGGVEAPRGPVCHHVSCSQSCNHRCRAS